MPDVKWRWNTILACYVSCINGFNFSVNKLLETVFFFHVRCISPSSSDFIYSDRAAVEDDKRSKDMLAYIDAQSSIKPFRNGDVQHIQRNLSKKGCPIVKRITSVWRITRSWCGVDTFTVEAHCVSSNQHHSSSVTIRFTPTVKTKLIRLTICFFY